MRGGGRGEPGYGEGLEARGELEGVERLVAARTGARAVRRPPAGQPGGLGPTCPAARAAAGGPTMRALARTRRAMAAVRSPAPPRPSPLRCRGCGEGTGGAGGPGLSAQAPGMRRRGWGRAGLGLRATRSISLVRMRETSTSEFSLVSRSCATKLAAPLCPRSTARREASERDRPGPTLGSRRERNARRALCTP